MTNKVPNNVQQWMAFFAKVILGKEDVDKDADFFQLYYQHCASEKEMHDGLMQVATVLLALCSDKITASNAPVLYKAIKEVVEEFNQEPILKLRLITEVCGPMALFLAAAYRSEGDRGQKETESDKKRQRRQNTLWLNFMFEIVQSIILMCNQYGIYVMSKDKQDKELKTVLALATSLVHSLGLQLGGAAHGLKSSGVVRLSDNIDLEAANSVK